MFEWFPIGNDDKMKYFYEKCLSGLEKLTECYGKDSIIHHTLTHYCSLFTNILENKEIEKEVDIEKESPLLQDFKTLWKEEEINIIFHMLQYLEISTDDEEMNIYLQNIDNIISMKEKKIYDYIQKSSTSYN